MNICWNTKENIKEKLERKLNRKKVFSLETELEKLHNLSMVNVDFNITSHRKYVGKLIVFIKQCIRKTIKWYVSPLIEQQNKINQQQEKIINEIFFLVEGDKGQNGKYF